MGAGPSFTLWSDGLSILKTGTLFVPRIGPLSHSWRGNPHNRAGGPWSYDQPQATNHPKMASNYQTVNSHFSIYMCCIYCSHCFVATNSQPSLAPSLELTLINKIGLPLALSCFLQQNSVVVEYSGATVHVHVHVGPVRS